MPTEKLFRSHNFGLLSRYLVLTIENDNYWYLFRYLITDNCIYYLRFDRYLFNRIYNDRDLVCESVDANFYRSITRDREI